MKLRIRRWPARPACVLAIGVVLVGVGSAGARADLDPDPGIPCDCPMYAVDPLHDLWLDPNEKCTHDPPGGIAAQGARWVASLWTVLRWMI